jgi:DNA polymerase III subunit gamma/tau
MDPAPRYETAAQPVAVPQTQPAPRSYLELVTLAGEKRDIQLKIALETQMRPVSFREKAIEVALVPGANPAIIQTLSARLREWTGQVWGISVSTAPATGPTIRDVKDQVRAKADAEAVEDPLVKAILERFPGSKVTVKLQEEQIPDTAYEDAFFEEREDD